MISGGERQFQKKARSLGGGALSREEIHGALYNALCRFLDKKNLFHYVGFEQITWIMVSCFLCIGVLGFSWFFFFGGHAPDSASMMAWNLEIPFESF